MTVDVHDLWADPQEALADYGLTLTARPDRHGYDGVVVAVAHDAHRKMGIEAIRALGRETHVLYNLKGVFGPTECDLRL